MARMDKTSHEPERSEADQIVATADGQAELADIVSVLERSLVRIEALGLTLPAALLDHAVSEAKRHLID